MQRTTYNLPSQLDCGFYHSWNHTWNNYFCLYSFYWLLQELRDGWRLPISRRFKSVKNEHHKFFVVPELPKTQNYYAVLLVEKSFFGGILRKKKTAKQCFPYHPCMVYSPTFTIEIHQMWVNIPWMVWVWFLDEQKWVVHQEYVSPVSRVKPSDGNMSRQAWWTSGRFQRRKNLFGESGEVSFMETGRFLSFYWRVSIPFCWCLQYFNELLHLFFGASPEKDRIWWKQWRSWMVLPENLAGFVIVFPIFPIPHLTQLLKFPFFSSKFIFLNLQVFYVFRASTTVWWKGRFGTLPGHLFRAGEPYGP